MSHVTASPAPCIAQGTTCPGLTLITVIKLPTLRQYVERRLFEHLDIDPYTPQEVLDFFGKFYEAQYYTYQQNVASMKKELYTIKKTEKLSGHHRRR